MSQEGMYYHLSAYHTEAEDLPLALDVLKKMEGTHNAVKLVNGEGILQPVSEETVKTYEWMDKMSNSSRDTQFQNFAKLLEREINDWQMERIKNIASGVEDAQAIRDIIARRAYDLVVHTIVELDCRGVLDFSDPDFDKYEYVASEMVEIIPDMTELPKEET